MAPGTNHPAPAPVLLQSASIQTPLGIPSIDVPANTSEALGASPPASASAPLQSASNHNSTGTGLAGDTTSLGSVICRPSVPASAPVDQSLNPQSPTTPISAARCEAFEQAIKKFNGTLSDEDKEAFQSASDIMERLHSMQSDQNSRISNSHILRARKILQCMQHFMGSISIFIQAKPGVCSLVVGGVNCVLTASILELLIMYSSGC